MPGFIDSLTHVDDESNLILFVANGVTTVRNTAGGYARHLALRDRVARGQLLGPTIVTTGGDITSPPVNYDSMEPVTTSAQAERIVEEVKRMDFNGVMVYSRISPDAHRGVIAAAKRLGLPVTGHQSLNVSPIEIAQSGQRSVENLIGYVRLSTGELGLSNDRVDAMAAAFREHGVFLIPTFDGASCPRSLPAVDCRPRALHPQVSTPVYVET
jgi:cytosine/adenosine deaminase-related metal-dependent hydrolase